MRVLVIGGGYAGVVAVTRLERELASEHELVLVDPRASHCIRHELHRVIRRPDFAERIQIPFETILDRAIHRQERVTALDPEAGTVTLGDDETMAYDAAIVSVGTETAFYGLEGVRTNAIPLDTPADAQSIGERAAALIDAGEGDVVVGGGGLAGVQAAGELAQARHDSGAEALSVTLVEQAPTVAPQFDRAFGSRLTEALTDLDVCVMTDAEIRGATTDSVELSDGTALPADLFVWTGGIRGRPPLGGERPQVRADLRLGPATFAAGDAARIVDVDGQAVSPSAQTAIRTARVAAENVALAIDATQRGTGGRPRYRRYRDETYAWVVSVGDRAFAKVGPQILSGPPAKALKSTTGVGYLSSTGAIREAVTLVRDEFGFGGLG
jgi:NADH dehydrogenase